MKPTSFDDFLQGLAIITGASTIIVLLVWGIIYFLRRGETPNVKDEINRVIGREEKDDD